MRRMQERVLVPDTHKVQVPEVPVLHESVSPPIGEPTLRRRTEHPVGAAGKASGTNLERTEANTRGPPT